jgi:hypothetical protein
MVQESGTARSSDGLTRFSLVQSCRSLPSQYLYPIIDNVPNRPILFYDQLGCGKSDEPKQKE